MYNYINTTISLLVKMGLLTEEAGQHLSVELGKKIHFDKYNQSFMTVEEVVNELEQKDKKFLAEPWMAHIRQLEKRVTDLETHMADCERMINVHGQKIQALKQSPLLNRYRKKI